MQSSVLQGFRLSPRQQHVWRAAGGVAQSTIEITGSLDPRRLARAVERAVERHEILRTTFPLLPALSVPVQSVEDAAPLAALDWSARRAGLERQSAADLERLCADLRETPFDLAAGPLLRATLVEMDPERHVLVLTQPALAADGASLDLLAAEIAAAYHGRPVADEVLQYADLAELLHDWQSSPAEEPGPAFWRRQDLAALVRVTLPGGHRSRRSLARDPVAGAAARLGTAVSTVLLAAWHGTLHLSTGAEEIVIGTLFDGRTCAELETALGPFAHYLPVPLRATVDSTLAELSRDLSSTLAEISRRQDFYSAEPVEALLAGQGLAGWPFGFEARRPPELPAAPGSPAFTIAGGHLDLDRFAVRLSVFDDGRALRIDLPEALLDRFCRVLDALLASAPLGEIDVLTEAERRQVLAFNATESPVPGGLCAHHLFEERARLAPDAPALLHAGKTWTYAALNAGADRRARRLRAAGLGPGALIGLSMGRSPALVEALLGILKAGAAYVPLDPGAPAERRAWMAEDAGLSLVLTETSEEMEEDLAGAAGAAGPAGPEDLAYVLYTSGSTGRPKGVMIPHRALVNYLLWARRAYAAGKGAGAPVHSAIGFDLTVTSLLVPLAAGTAVTLLDDDGGNPVGALAAALRGAPGFSLVKLTPAHLDALRSELRPEEHAGAARALVIGGEALRAESLAPWREQTPETRLINEYGPTEATVGCCVYEIAPGDSMSALFGREDSSPLGGGGLEQGGGQEGGATKGHKLSLSSVLPDGGAPLLTSPLSQPPPSQGGGKNAALPDAPLSGPVPIGRPIANTRLYVVGPRLRPVPPGAPGELWIGGDGLALGYLGSPELTAGRFVPDPFAAAAGRAGERLYRTGDLVRLRPDGQLEFLGRVDHQIKIRGFRVEPGEIEAALAAHAEVREVVVLPAEEPAGSLILVACIAGTVSPGDLRRHLLERLPEPMVPSRFAFYEALPLTANGKVDRRELARTWREKTGAAAEPAAEEAPRGWTEELLAGIFAELLGLPRVGRGESFFALGGHSLLATQAVSRIRTAFGVEMTLRALFEAPAVAALAARVEALRAREGGEGTAAPPLVPARHAGPLPLSFAQQRLWFIDQLTPGSPLYNIPVALRAEGALRPAVLAASLGEIVRRHGALRTVFPVRAGAPAQVILPAAPCALPVADLSALPASRREAAALALAGEEAVRPFDLAHGPLLRGLLLRLEAGDWVAALTMHHIVSDGWSIGLLIREVTALYAAFAAGAPSPLPELPVQYADFSVWQQSWLRGAVLESEIEFWRRQLAGLPPLLDLPTDRPRPAAQSFRGAARPFRLPAGLARQAEALGRREGATLFMVLLAAFQALLARLSGQRDFAVGAPVAGRTRREIEDLIGFFVNTLVLRGDLNGEPAFRELVARVRETALAAHAHQDVPFEKLVQELTPERSLAHTPLFQVVLALQNAPAEALEIAGLRLRPVGAAGTTAKFDLLLSLGEHHGALAGTAEYATDLFDAATVDRLTGQLERLLAAALAAPDQAVADLPLLSPAERHQMLLEWNDTASAAAEPGEEALIHELFEAWAARTPGAVAVLCGGATLTYGEVEEQAERLARRLEGLGIGPGALVGIHLRRSAAMIPALLAVLKAGAAYVPLEIGHPPARRRWILDALEISWLLTETAQLDSVRALAAPALAHVLCLDRPEAGEAVAEAANAAVEPIGPIGRIRPIRPIRQMGSTAARLAYVIFTSGSTGTPKGVMVRHRPVVDLIRWAHRTFAFSPADRVLCVASLAFDLSVFDIFGLLGAGGSVRIATEEEIRDPERLLRALTDEPITFWDSAPAALEQTVPFLSRIDPQARPALRLVFLSGDWIPVTLPDRLRSRFPAARVIALGGATEATVWSNVFPVGVVDPAWTSIPYGRPIDNARYHVLDERLAPCPVGVPGDLYIGGGCLADGYAREPELTARKFIPDPWSGFFGDRPGARLYATGDRARYRADGNLEFLGRRDSQVKIRGFRIELGEIEAALASLPGVREAVVAVREDRPGDRRLVAYVTGEAVSGNEDLRSLLRERLRERLPEPMIPAAFVALAALPLTANGKVDRKALPAPEQPVSAPSRIAPRTPVEEALAGIWAELLGVPREGIGAGDDFFDLGGHSLLATRLLAAVRDAFRVDLPLRLLFEQPTVAGLAAAIAEAGAGEAHDPIDPDDLITPLPRMPGENRFPVSFAQLREWILDGMEPGNPAYNIPSPLRIEGPLAVPALIAALRALVHRHEVFRTRFAILEADEAGEGGETEPLQIVLPEVHLEVPVIDLSALPESEQAEGSSPLGGGGLEQGGGQEGGAANGHHPPISSVVPEVGAPLLTSPLSQPPPAQGGGKGAAPEKSTPQGKRAAELRRLARDEAGASFDLAAAPLLRTRLVHLAPGDHALLLTVHHIVADGWSLGILHRDVAALYEAADLPDLPIQYADYAAWQRRRLAGERLERLADVWRRRLAGMPASLDLATDRPRPPVRSSRGGTVPILLPPPLAGRLAELARRHGATLFMVLLAGYQALLGRWSGQDEAVVGTYSGSRPRRELEGLIGFFIDTLALRTSLAGDPSFGALLGRVRETTLEAQAHSALPFEKLLEILAPPRDPSRTPLFQALLVLQSFPATRASLGGGVRLSSMEAAGEAAAFDVELWLGEGPEGIAGALRYSAALFDAATMARFAAQLSALLEAAVAEPGRNVWELPLVAAGGQALQIEAWSRGPAVPAGEPLLHRLVEEQAARTPGAVALEAGALRLTYAELVDRARREARHLRTQGIGRGSIVALDAERTPDLIVSMLAVLQAGAAYLPLDPAYPQERRDFMVADSGATKSDRPVPVCDDREPVAVDREPVAIRRGLAAVDRELAADDRERSPGDRELIPGDRESIPGDREMIPGAAEPVPGARQTILEDGERTPGEGEAAPGDRHPAPVDAEDAAYVIYTSGSTGNPKGVVVPHRAIASFVRGARGSYGLAAGDRVLQLASLSFDTSAEEIWPALAAGATLVLRPDDMLLSIPHFLRELERLAVTVLDLPTAFWHELVAHLESAETGGMEMPRRLRLVILGGEEALADRFAAWRRYAGSSVRLVNTYGPTEATIVATRRDLTDLAPGALVPIGRPIAGARAHVLDRFLAPLPPGLRGELWIGGAGVARGYLGRPDLTAERFLPDPFAAPAEPGARLYRTGDLAVLRSDGDLLFADRADRQLKVRGYRIEPGEIEAALRRHPLVHDAAVDVRGGENGADRRLVAWVVARPGAAALEPAALRAFLRERLPEPMLPALLVPVPALPLTPAGKVDRRALPAPAPPPDRAAEVGYREPGTAIERTVAAIFRSLLGVDRVGLNDNFFDLGGHSLLVLRAQRQLSEALGKEIPVVDLFRFPTVALLARHLEAPGGRPEEGKPSFHKVQDLAGQQRAAQVRQKQAMERMRRPLPGKK